MLEQIAGFDWDHGNRAKCQMHGVSIAEIEAALTSNPRIAPDVRHSGQERRLIAVNRTDAGLALFVSFTIRERVGLQFVRPISARYMHSKEAVRYAKSTYF